MHIFKHNQNHLDMIHNILNVDKKVRIYNPQNATLKRLVICKLQITSIKRNIHSVPKEYRNELINELKRLNTRLPKIASFVEFKELCLNDKILFNQFK